MTRRYWKYALIAFALYQVIFVCVLLLDPALLLQFES
jgi:hypothetical protein